VAAQQKQQRCISRGGGRSARKTTRWERQRCVREGTLNGGYDYSQKEKSGCVSAWESGLTGSALTISRVADAHRHAPDGWGVGSGHSVVRHFLCVSLDGVTRVCTHATSHLSLVKHFLLLAVDGSCAPTQPLPQRGGHGCGDAVVRRGQVCCFVRGPCGSAGPALTRRNRHRQSFDRERGVVGDHRLKKPRMKP